MKDLMTWLNTLPPAVGFLLAPILSLTSALIVAVISRRGITIQIQNENRRFERKLEHEAEEKTKERAMQMKREAFMIVCEGLALGTQYISKFADQEIPRDKHQQLISDITPRLSRVHLIANDVTIHALIQAYDFFLESVYDLEGERLSISLLRA